MVNRTNFRVVSVHFEMASGRDMASLIDNTSDECYDEEVNKGDEENTSDECSDQAAYTTETIKEFRYDFFK